MWIFAFVAAGFVGIKDPMIVRDLTEAQCRAMVLDFATDRSFAACYADDGRVIKKAD